MAKKGRQELFGYDILYKLVLIGDSGVGKSQLLSRFTKNEFSHDSKSTIGVEFASKLVSIEGKVIAAQIWDTAGQERYQAITSTYYRGAVGALLCYDLTSFATFEHVDKWLFELKECTDDDVEVMLVGNKADMEFIRQVSTREGAVVSKALGLSFIEASALSGNNVEKAFTELIRQIYLKKSKNQAEEKEDRPKLAVGTAITLSEPPAQVYDQGRMQSNCNC